MCAGEVGMGLWPLLTFHQLLAQPLSLIQSCFLDLSLIQGLILVLWGMSA